MTGGEANRITVLRTLFPMVTAKRYEPSAAGPIVLTAFGKAAHFHVTQEGPQNIHDLHALLGSLESQTNTCIIRGEPIAELDRSEKTPRNGKVFKDAPRHWVMVDLDKIPAPPGFDILADPEDAARRVLDLLVARVPELEGVTAIVQHSSSAGIAELAEAERAVDLPDRWRGVLGKGRPTVSAHIWWWLAEPLDSATLNRWAKAVNDDGGIKLFDPNVFHPIQVCYTSAPIFGGNLRDHLAGKRTWLIEGEAEAATLAIPAVPARPSKGAWEPGQQASTSLTYEGWLSAIGGANGFQKPIMQAVMAFVRANWPSPDIGALVADVAAHVLAADPGERGPADIARYASEQFISEKAQWAIAARQGWADEQAALAKARAATPIAPTYPDRGIPLAKAQERLATVMRTFGTRIGEGEAPQLLVNITVGGSKTYSAIVSLPLLIDIGRALGLGPILFTHPMHQLGDQIAADIRQQHPRIRVAIWRGMDAADPDSPGNAMCTVPELPAEARKASQGSTHGCTICPAAAECAYLAQKPLGANADVWIAPHHVVTRAPFAGWPRDADNMPKRPTAIITDEDPTGAWVSGTNEPISFDLEKLETGPVSPLEDDDLERLEEFRREAFNALIGQPKGNIFREGLEFFENLPQSFTVGGVTIALGGTSPAMQWHKLEWATKPKVKLPKDCTKEDAVLLYKEAAKKGFSSRRTLLAKLIGDFMATTDARSVNIQRTDKNEITFAYRADIDEGWQSPAMLFLGATTQPEILKFWAPELETVEIEVSAPHQYVVQIPKEFGQSGFAKGSTVKDVANGLLVETAMARGATLCIMQKYPEKLLRAEIEDRGGLRDALPKGADEDGPATYRFPSGAVLHLAHFGDIVGKNIWKNVATVIVIGRHATERAKGERLAEVISGGAVGVVTDAADGWWPMRTAGIRMADGTGRAIDRQAHHPDATVEAVRLGMMEGGVIQAIGRGRGVRRTAANPLRVVVMAAMALPVTVAEVVEWQDYQPDRVTVAAAEAALFNQPLSMASEDLAKTLGLKVDALKQYLKRIAAGEGQSKRVHSLIVKERDYKEMYPLAFQAPFRFRRRASGGSWVKAQGPEGMTQADLEGVVGPVAAFEPIPTPIPAQAEPEPLVASVSVPGALLPVTGELHPERALVCATVGTEIFAKDQNIIRFGKGAAS